MARDHARIGLSIWDDDDFRSLPGNAQHLYWMLLLHPELSYCGVMDWRPARLSGFVGDWSADDVQTAADILCERLYLLIDEGTEEVLVRSFVRHDGLMKQPKMATAMATAHSAVGSVVLRGVIVWELQRLHREEPDLKGWGSEKACALLTKPSVDPSIYPCGKGSGNPSVYPSGNPSPEASGNPSGKGSASPLLLNSLAPSSDTPKKTSSSSRTRTRATAAPDTLDITDRMRDWATTNHIAINLDRETARFLDHHRAKGSTFKDWTAAWRTWMSRAADYQPGRPTLAAVHTLDGTFTADELNAILGPPPPLPQPPRNLDAQQMWEWEQHARQEQRAERVRQANIKLGRPA